MVDEDGTGTPELELLVAGLTGVEEDEEGIGIEHPDPIEAPFSYEQGKGALEVLGIETVQSGPEPPLLHGTRMLELLVTGLTGVEETEQSGPEPPLLHGTGMLELLVTELAGVEETEQPGPEPPL